MADDVLSVRYSPNGKLLAVALLDSTVKVFYQDSLKFFLSLYGHKVRCIVCVHLLLSHSTIAARTLNGHLSRLEADSHLFRGQKC
jgi:WD40 repeat protein